MSNNYTQNITAKQLATEINRLTAKTGINGTRNILTLFSENDEPLTQYIFRHNQNTVYLDVAIQRFNEFTNNNLSPICVKHRPKTHNFIHKKIGKTSEFLVEKEWNPKLREINPRILESNPFLKEKDFRPNYSNSEISQELKITERYYSPEILTSFTTDLFRRDELKNLWTIFRETPSFRNSRYFEERRNGGTAVYNYQLKMAKALYEKQVGFKIFGDVERDEQDDVFYILEHRFRTFNGKVIKDKKLKSPKSHFRVPTLSASIIGNQNKKVEQFFIAEGKKDFLTLTNMLFTNQIKNSGNWIVLLALGVNDIPTIVARIEDLFMQDIKVTKENLGENLEKPKIYISADNDEAGDNAVRKSYKKMKRKHYKYLYFLEWDGKDFPKNSDITDYYESGKTVTLKDFISSPEPMSEEEINRTNEKFEKGFYRFSGDKYLSNIVEKNLELKNILENSRQDIILQSMMGSGKSAYFSKEFPQVIKNRNRKELLFSLSPLKVLEKELRESGFKNIYNFYGIGNISNRKFFSSTMQHFNLFRNRNLFENELRIKIEQGFTVTFIIDEAHIFNSLVSKGYSHILKMKDIFGDKVRIIRTTATANKLFLLHYRNRNVVKIDIQSEKLQFQSLQSIFYKKSEKLKKLIKYLTNLKGKKVVLHLNSNRESLILKTYLDKIYKVNIVNKANPETNFAKYNLHIVTSVLEFGLNIFKSNVDNIISLSPDIDSFTQFIGRFRDRKDAEIIHFQKDSFREKEGFGLFYNDFFIGSSENELENLKTIEDRLERKLSPYILKQEILKRVSFSEKDTYSEINITDFKNINLLNIAKEVSKKNIEFSKDIFNKNIETENRGSELMLFIKRELPKDEKYFANFTFETLNSFYENFQNLELSSEIFFKNFSYLGNRTVNIYQNILIAQAVNWLYIKYGTSKIHHFANQRLSEILEEKDSNKNEMLYIIYLAQKSILKMNRNQKLYYGIYNLSKTQQNSISKIADISKDFRDGNISKYGLEDFDNNLFSADNLNKFIEHHWFFKDITLI